MELPARFVLRKNDPKQSFKVFRMRKRWQFACVDLRILFAMTICTILFIAGKRILSTFWMLTISLTGRMKLKRTTLPPVKKKNLLLPQSYRMNHQSHKVLEGGSINYPSHHLKIQLYLILCNPWTSGGKLSQGHGPSADLPLKKTLTYTDKDTFLPILAPCFRLQLSTPALKMRVTGQVISETTILTMTLRKNASLPSTVLHDYTVTFVGWPRGGLVYCNALKNAADSLRRRSLSLRRDRIWYTVDS
ncbi:hypothetical protein VTP01DRAFT_6292 [Rhizomucor pusillus]|uniref:uncharacterized protein n=1 Tax=Rhizomucor pusillus TaxID=4840 RepID=UPI0037442290